MPVAIFLGKLGSIGAAASALLLASADASSAAAIAGSFAVLNTAVLMYVANRQRRLEKVLAAPRRAVYDADGQLIGTVLDLKDPIADALHIAAVSPHAPPSRRVTDFPEEAHSD